MGYETSDDEASTSASEMDFYENEEEDILILQTTEDAGAQLYLSRKPIHVHVREILNFRYLPTECFVAKVQT